MTMPTEAEARRLLRALDAVLALPRPVGEPAGPGFCYPEAVSHLIGEINHRWADKTYSPARDGAWLHEAGAAAALDVEGLGRALTWFMRAERFAEGAWRAAIGDEGLGRLRARLGVLLAEGAFEALPCF
ncbi:MAG: hypothetical protein ACI8S6_003436, partial [Myxococcota bacterium]